MTSKELRSAAGVLYRRHYDALLKSDEAGAVRLKVRADYLNTASVTGFRVPALEALALQGDTLKTAR